MEELKSTHILMVHQGGVGDFILCLPAFESIRRYYPKARIELLGYSRVLQLVEGRYYVDRGTSVDGLKLGPLYREDGHLGTEVVRFFGGFDLAFVFTQDRHGVFSGNLRRAGVKRVLSIPPFPEEGRRIHVIDHVLSSLSSMGIPPGGRIPRIFLRGEDRRFAETWLRGRCASEGREKGLVGLHPGSGSRKNLWPIGNFLDLAQRITHDLRLNTILLVGPAEREYVGEGLEPMQSINPIWAENLPLIYVASLLERCRCYIGNDSGITHLAAAVGTPTIALFGPTDPEVWGPRGGRVTILWKSSGCSPCTGEELDRCTHRRCLATIEVEEVIEKAKELMSHG